MIKLEVIKRTDPRILDNMANHYSAPKGFVGRNVCFAVIFDGAYYGAIVGGSATLHLPGRKEFIKDNWIPADINRIVNNVFYHVTGPYPIRNFTTKVLYEFENRIYDEWWKRYHSDATMIETLVELPRTGDTYLRAGYKLIGQTVGYTCKRVGGVGSDSWSGRRVWNTNKAQLRPKLVFAKKF